MKNELLHIAKELGFDAPKIRCERPASGSVVYYVSVYKSGKLIKNWDGGYFTNEENTPNSKDKVLPRFRKFLTTLAALESRKEVQP